MTGIQCSWRLEIRLLMLLFTPGAGCNLMSGEVFRFVTGGCFQ